ncbi:hypothetical protein D3C71_1379580 [compost metagenome]
MIDNSLDISSEEIFPFRLAAPRLRSFRIIAGITVREPLRHNLVEDGVFGPRRHLKQIDRMDERIFEVAAGRKRLFRQNAFFTYKKSLIPGFNPEIISQTSESWLHMCFPIIKQVIRCCDFHLSFGTSTIPIVFIAGYNGYCSGVAAFGANPQMYGFSVVSIGPFVPRHMIQCF